LFRKDCYDAPMPKVVDHAERRAQIVAATWDALGTVGLEGATMRTIAERAGCSTGRLTHYFASREEILIAALRQVHELAGTRMISAAAGATGADAVRAVLLEALPLDAERRREWRVWLAFWAQATVDPALREENERRYAEWREVLDRLLVEAVPGLGADERAGRVEDLVAIIDGLGVQATLDTGKPGRRRSAALRGAVDRAVERAVERATAPPPAVRPGRGTRSA
jgi:AcrR family transcriptional regulator